MLIKRLVSAIPKEAVFVLQAFFFLGFCANDTPAQTTGPQLRFERLDSARFRISWDSSTGQYRLEEASNLRLPVVWTQNPATPLLNAGRLTVDITPANSTLFLRLSGPSVASTNAARFISSSPQQGESGVSATRETILRFDKPLARTTILSIDKFHAESAGRRLLSRAELSSDRQTATLFFLENLPGSARVVVTFQGDDFLDDDGRQVDGDGDGEPGGDARVEFDTFSRTAIEGTAVIGRVFASDLVPGSDTGTNSINRPLAGVIIAVDGAEETLRTTTDELGNFTLDPAPAGRFFVHVDGRYAASSQWPNGSYYPFVGKAWEAVAGIATNLAGGNGAIYLPLVVAGTLQPVSSSEATTITFPASVLAKNPALAGVSVVVPPNALFSDNGTRGGKVGIAPVPPDRLPEKLPPGLAFPIVITVQSDGPSNFDQPVPIRFPNLPDPLTGRVLPPGAKSALWAFNHDTGQWQIEGPMTVSADGKFIECDPSTGVRQPGWFGSQPGTEGKGGPAHANPPKKKNECDCNESIKLAQIENLLLQVAAGFAVLPDGLSENYGGDMLQHFLVGDGTPINHGPDSDFAEDVLDSKTFQEEEYAINAELFSRITDAIAQNPDNPTVSNFEHADQGMNFYLDDVTVDVPFIGEVKIPSKLGTSFGGLSKGDVKIDLSNIQLQKNADGTYSYSADVSVHLSEVYEFNRNDPEGFSALAGCLQKCGMTTPFTTSVQANTKFSGTFQPLQPLRALNRGFAARPEVGPGDPQLALQVATTTEIKIGDKILLVTPGGETFFGPPDDTQSGLLSFVIEEVATGEVALRGTMSGEGVAQRSVILRPDTRYRQRLAQVPLMRTGTVEFTTPASGQSFEIPRTLLAASRAGDLDRDAVPDDVEDIVGTDRTKADSDGDGLSDGTEFLQGSNPLDDRLIRTGVIASVPTPEPATDLCAFNEAVAVCGGNNVYIFNVFAGLDPVLISEVSLPERATDIACSGELLAVACSSGVLVTIDVSDPSEPRVLNTLPLAGVPTGLAAAGSVAYVAVPSAIVMVDLLSGMELNRRAYGTGIHELALAGDWLYMISSEGGVLWVRKVRLENQLRDAVSSFELTGYPLTPFRLFAGDGLVYISGLDNVQSIPGIGILRDLGTNFAWAARPAGITALDVAVNGSGLALFTGADPDILVNQRVAVLDVRDPTRADQFVTSFDTPGNARAVAIHNGRGYVADGGGGLAVINYQADDVAGVPPRVQLQTSFPSSPATVQAGTRVRATASVSDDRQVRNVEFYLDDQRIAHDGSFPFEHFFTIPNRAADRLSFRLRAKAIDTGGNSAWSDEMTVTVLPKQAPHEVLYTIPPDGSSVGNVRTLAVLFGDPIAPASVGMEPIILLEAGADGNFGSGDDIAIRGGEVIQNESINALLLRFADDFRPGRYRAVLARTITDLAGQPLPADKVWDFSVTSTTIPRVLSFAPASGSTSEQLLEVSVVFSEAIQAGSVGTNSLRLVATGTDGVLGTADDFSAPLTQIRLAAPNKLVANLPAELPYGAYRADVGSGLLDLAGNSFGAVASWQFRLEDRTAPMVLTVAPPNASIFADGISEIEAYFSEPISLATLTQDSFTIRHAGADGLMDTGDDVSLSSAAFDYNAALRRSTLRFPASLGPQTYRAELTGAVKDRSGKALANPQAWSFTIQARTRVEGQLQLPSGEPIMNGAVFVPGFGAISNITGRFVTGDFHIDLAAVISVSAEARIGDQLFAATIRGLKPVHGGTTSAGVLVLQETCDPRFAANLFPVNGPPGIVEAYAMFDDGAGPALYAACSGGFTPDFDQGGVYKWTGVEWFSVGGEFSNGKIGNFNNSCAARALLVFDDGTGPALYAGGQFTSIGNVPATNIARWNGRAWTSLDTGLGGEVGIYSVRALAAYNDGSGPGLVAGGQFTRAGMLPVNNIARWNGRQWVALGAGLSSSLQFGDSVHALAVFDNALFAGGYFSRSGPVSVMNIAKWNGSQWSGLSGGTSGSVKSLATFNDGTGPGLYVGGAFEQAGNLTVNNIARWSGSAWSALGSGVSESFDSPAVNSLTVYDDGSGPMLVVGGLFGMAGDIRAGPGRFNSIARWNGSAWSSLGGADTNVWVTGSINALLAVGAGPDALLYVGGNLNQAGSSLASTPVLRAASWRKGRWSPVGNGIDIWTSSLGVFDDGKGPALYLGGTFRAAGTNEANGVARWNGRTYAPLSTGLRPIREFSSVEANAFATFDDGTGAALYLGGRFGSAGDVPATNIARWDGRAWRSVGGGLGGSGGFVGREGQVNALIVWNNDARSYLVAGGEFNIGGGATSGSVARWDGTNWFPLGSELLGRVNALAIFDDGTGPALYAGGNITTRNGLFFSNIAKWNGTEWEPLGGASQNSLDNEVFAMTVHNDGSGPALYVGGSFSRGSSVSLGSVGKWTGREWKALGQGLANASLATVRALSSFDDGTGPALYAGGQFNLGAPDNILNIARWTEGRWLGMARGLGTTENQNIKALTVFDDGSGPALFAGGYFFSSGNTISQSMAKWHRPIAPCPLDGN